MSDTQKISTFLWFDSNAEEAANHYVSIFDESEILGKARYGEAGPGPEGTVMTITFQLGGHEFIALNGGSQFRFTEAISLFVKCDTQEEIDRLWSKLAAGGEEGQCGWLKDKFGVSWQVVPSCLLKMIQDEQPAKSKRVMETMLQMKKMNVAALQHAYENHEP